ncbi:moonshiner-like [Drosophila innubila]|uniref:moonshiner-like n=1 Tax=Drosophila innubila TaxID=198719 RepID=UPI00148D8C71|nr:moonshiner-like [Drosophila innubila]
MARMKKNESWIPESRNFFTDVMKDVFANMSGNEMFELSRTEGMQLEKLEKLWLINYKPLEHLPESNPCPLPPKPKRAPQKSQISTTITTSSTITAATTITRTTFARSETEDEKYVDASTLDDNLDIVYRINIPRLRPHWRHRSMDLKIKAIMELPTEEATTLFQSHVDQMLQAA